MTLFQTRNFGEIEVKEDDILIFPLGLPGFHKLRQFTLIPEEGTPDGEESVFIWLQSLEDPEVAFCLINLARIMPEYSPLVEGAEISALGQCAITDYLVYNITVIPDDPKDITVNMKAPVIINPGTKKGMQVICQNDDYAIRHRLFEQ